MDKAKIIVIGFILIFLGSASIAFKFYSDNKKLAKEAATLEQNISFLEDENKRVVGKNSRLESERNELANRMGAIQEALSQAEASNKMLQRRYEEVAQQRDMLVEKLKQRPGAASGKRQEKPVESSVREAYSQEHWADIVKAKVELEVILEKMQKDLVSAKNELDRLAKENRALNLKIDDLLREQIRSNEEIAFKETTVKRMSRDLVSEREARKDSFKQLAMLKKQNVGLKRELVMANQEKVHVQTALAEMEQKKKELEDQVSYVENIMKEKSMIFDELQETLQQAIAGEKVVMSDESASVELPPIVVKPQVSLSTPVQGKVLAVNPQDKFIIVDRGELSGMRVGMLMSVLRQEREIGTIEIIETRRDISAADIKVALGGYTVQEGDVVVSK